MAALFLVSLLAMIAVLFSQRKCAIALLLVLLIGALLMLWHHATTLLKINL